MNRTLPVLVILSLLAACNNNHPDTPATGSQPADNTPPLISYSVMKTLPHDTSSFTEGFLVHDGKLWESIGTDSNMPPNRKSLFGSIDSATGKISPKVELDRKKYFGEGIVFLNGKVYQLTYKTKIGFIYDATTFRKLGEFTFPSPEGWGMTTDGTHLIMSDGTSNIYFLDPNSTTPVETKIEYEDGTSIVKTLPSFKIARILGVTDNNGPDSNINELELIDGFLYANKWQTNYILKIDPASGKVVGQLNMDSIANDAKTKNPALAEMNGIAFDSVSHKIYVTGKLWPTIYEIRF